MKAVQINSYGGTSVIEINDVPRPTASNGQVLVRVHAASINPFDTTIREGSMRKMIPLTFPATLGGDIAGEVVAVGEEVDGIGPGDRIYGQANVVSGNSGAFAEYAATSVTQISRAPSGLNFTEAASLPLVGVSALQALTEHLNLQADHRLFIYGGAGGIGTVAIQIAKSIGAYVATTATSDGIEYVKRLGADQVIDYKAEHFTDVLTGYDAVFDTVGGDDFSKTLRILKKGGRAVSMIAPADEALAAELGVIALMQNTHVTTAMLDALAALVERKVVTPHVDTIYHLEQVRDAFMARESGTVRGKVVLTIP